jgi:hypothetical protein
MNRRATDLRNQQLFFILKKNYMIDTFPRHNILNPMLKKSSFLVIFLLTIFDNILKYLHVSQQANMNRQQAIDDISVCMS